MRTPLTPEEAARLPDLFAEASALPAEQQPGYLERACAGSASLRAEVESLLGFGSKLPEFLARPAIGRGLEQLGLGAAGELPPGTVLGEHRIVSLLGVGGMGEVYLAEDTVHGRQVALKLISQGQAEEVRGRHFRHERRVLAALNHPHIARLYGSGVTSDGQAYLVMEYVEGERLDSFCATRGLRINERLTLFRKVCAAVAYAHQNLVVHRDLKPANIRVTAEGEPKLLDFGIAKLLDPEGTTTGSDPTVTMHGAMTPEYASPEQLKGEPITTASDVYSLGVVLFELLCGQRPFAYLKGRRPDELARAVCEEEPPRPSTVVGRPNSEPILTTGPARPAPTTAHTPYSTSRRQLEGDLDNIVAKALQKAPTRRYPSALALSEDIRRHGEGLPVTARRDTLRYRTGKFVSRNKTGVAAASLLVLALVGGLVATTWQARLASQERDRAQSEREQARVAQRQAEHISGFLQSLLAGADPAKLGKDARLVQVVDAAAANLDHDLANEPEVLVQAHLTLSRTYRSLALFDPAEQQARGALAAIRRLHGPDELATANVEFALGDVLANRGNVTEGEPLLRHVMAVQRAQNPLDLAALGATLASLGSSLRLQPTRSAEADAIFAEALTDLKAAVGEHDRRYMNALNGAATIKVIRRDYAGALDAFRQSLALFDQIKPGDAGSLPLQINICLCLFNLEEYDQLEVTLKRFDADVQRLVGDNNMMSATGNLAHGLLNFERGENQSAAVFLQKALVPLSAAFAPDVISVVQCQAVLGLCLTRDHQAPEGEKWLRTAYEHGGKVDQADFAHTIGNLKTGLGECLLVQKRYAEAEGLLLPGLADLEERLGPQNRLTLQARQRLHDLYLALNKPAEATRYQSEATVQINSAP